MNTPGLPPLVHLDDVRLTLASRAGNVDILKGINLDIADGDRRDVHLPEVLEECHLPNEVVVVSRILVARAWTMRNLHIPRFDPAQGF